MTEPPIKSYRRWLRFNLRTALLVLTLLCIFFGTVARNAHQRLTSIAVIRDAGGTVEFQTTSQSWFDKCVSMIFGTEATLGVRAVRLREAHVEGDFLMHLAVFPELQELGLEKTQISDGGLKHLPVLRNLQYLMLNETAISDKGVVY